MPTEVKLHPDLPNYVRRVEGDPWTHRDRYGDQVRDWYEAGDVVVFDRHPLRSVDGAFVRSVPVLENAGQWAKKAKPKAILVPLDKGDYKDHVLANWFPKDKKAAARFQAQFSASLADGRAFVAYTFPGYKVTGANGCTWRFTLTAKEALHWDSYGFSTDDDHHVRLFVNLDDRTREWATSYRVDEAVRRYRDRLSAADRKLHPNLLNAVLNDKLPIPDLPRHFASFAPGAAWLVNSQVVSHEIIRGRKMAAFTYDVDPTTMARPERNFAALVRHTLKELA